MKNRTGEMFRKTLKTRSESGRGRFCRQRLSGPPLWRGSVLIALTLTLSLAPLSQARAECREGCDSSNPNTFLGEEALANNIGFFNTAVGSNALSDNAGGSDNTALGDSALTRNTSGRANTATGSLALFDNTTGHFNTASGFNALSGNTDGFYNTATGYNALSNNDTAYFNTATGADALSTNTTGPYNTATGYLALLNNTTGGYNAATGFASLPSNTTGYFNTADGVFALFTNTTGYQNIAGGVSALYYNTSGRDNTAIGYQALLGNTTGSSNIAVGSNAGLNLTTGNNNIIIGANVLGTATDANTTRIGVSTQRKTFINGISGKTVANGVTVLINTSGQLGTIQSSARFKEAIRPMNKASEAILALQPVTFRYKQELDSDGILQFGLVAEQVEKVHPDLVARDDEGKPYTVRYEAVNAMLLNEFLKEHKRVEEQMREIQELKKSMQTVVARLEEQDSKIQKVSAQIEISRPSRQMAGRDPRELLADAARESRE